MKNVTHYVGDTCDGGHRDEWAMSPKEFSAAMTEATDDEAMGPLMKAVERYRDDRFDATLNQPDFVYRAAVIETARLLVAMVRAEEAEDQCGCHEHKARLADARERYMKSGEGA